MDNQTHMIQKTTMHVKLHNRKDALKQQQQISVLFKEQIMPIISSVFDSLSTKNQTICIDTLDIKLGAINLDNHFSFLENFKAVFSKEVRKHIKDTKPYTENTNDYIFKHFINALKTGYFSWHTKYKNFDDIMKALLELDWNASRFYDLIHHLQSNKNSFKRLLFQASTPFLKRIQAEMMKHYQLSELNINAIQKNFKQESERNQLEFFIANVLIDYESSSQITSDVAHLNNKKTKDANQDLLEDRIDPDTLISIGNAGLVILNPIFSPLFERCNLLRDNTFTTLESHEKAVFILHYLATGDLELDESQSVLYKILCGMDINHPIPKTVKLSQNILNLCDDAMQSIISEWKALKNTGVEGLRENFIKREGNLKDQGDSYTLDVNQESVDVILNYSPPPWTVGMIKLPWMKKMLYVNWF